MNNWKKEPLGEGIRIKHGFAFKGEFFATEGTSIILTPGNFFEKGGFKYTPGKEKFYTGEIPEEYICKKGDLIVAMTEQAAGLLGSTALVPEDDVFLHNQRIGLISFDEEKYDKLFLYYLFQTKYVRDQIANSSSGSKVKHTSPERIYDVEVFRPPLQTQKEIGHFLYSNESKIELNNKINAELEGMAKLLYDYWFVQFDFPNAEGKPYKSSGGKMVYNDQLKRDIPEGWEVDIVGNLLKSEKLGGKTPSSEYRLSGQIPIIDQSIDFICGFTDDLNKKINGSEQPRIVFGDHTRILKLINFDFVRGADGTQVLLSKHGNVPQHFFYHSLLKIDLSNYGYARHFKFLKDTKTIIPNAEVSTEFEKLATTWYKKIWQNIQENQKLSELRDWLLPMLMNGQVTVGE